MQTISTPRTRRALRLKMRALRDELGLSQQKATTDLRRKFPMNGTRWCNIENGVVEATEAERAAIEKFFKVPPGTIPWVTVPRLITRRRATRVSREPVAV